MNNTGICGLFVVMYYLISAATAYFTVAVGDVLNIKMNTPVFRAMAPCISSAVTGLFIVLIYFLSGRFKSYCVTNFKKPKMCGFLKLIPLSAAVWLCGMFLNTIINTAAYRFFDITPVQQISSSPMKPVQFLNFLNVCITAPVFEELFFRGVLYDSGKDYGTQIAVLMSSLMFAIAHSSVTVFGLPLVMGIVSAFILVKTGNIFYCIFLHALCNGASFVVTLLPQSQKIIIAENLFIIICGAVITFTVFVWARKKIAVFLKNAVLQITRYFSSSSEIIAFVAIVLYYIFINYTLHFIK